MNQRKGFTLVELLVVMTVIMILMGFLLATIFGAWSNTYRADAALMIRNIYNGIETYKLEKMHYPTPEKYRSYEITNHNYSSPPDPADDVYGLARECLLDDGRTEDLITASDIREQNANSFAEYMSFDREFFVAHDSNTYKSLLDPWEQPYRYAYKADDAAKWLSDSIDASSAIGGATEKNAIKAKLPSHDIYIWSAGPDNEGTDLSKGFISKWRDTKSGLDLPIYLEKGK
ncbi:MAG: type II secretion system protein [Planctomycetes bacterium]|nr:type II secretion system protein [Planctomycetota bacterium]